MSPEPTGRSLSDQLKRLQYAEPPLDPSSFTLDDVVRGGRRRRQRRTAAQIAAAVVAVAALGTGVALPQLHGNGAPPAVAPTISSAPALPRVDLSDGKLKLVQNGAAVTVSKSGTVVATVTLTSATYAAKSGRAVFSVDAKQPVLIDTSSFVMYDSDGGENSADSARKMTLSTGKSMLTLNFNDTHGKPEAVGWIPQAGSSDGGLWER